MARARARTSYLVKRLETLIRSELDGICTRRGVSTMQYVALSVLAVHPGTSSAELAVRSFVSPQSANQIVTALEREGLICRSPDAQNRRILRIELTADGLKVLASCDEAVDELEARMLADVEPSEELRRLLEACIANLAPRPVRRARPER